MKKTAAVVLVTCCVAGSGTGFAAGMKSRAVAIRAAVPRTQLSYKVSSTPVTAPRRAEAARQESYKIEPLERITKKNFARLSMEAYRPRRDFGKSNLIKWSSKEGLHTPWGHNRVTGTAHFKPTTMAFLDTLNRNARKYNVNFIITGGSEKGFHSTGTYSHENGYKVDISNNGVGWGSRAFKVLRQTLALYKHQFRPEPENGHYDITIYPRDYRGGYSGYSYKNFI